MSDLIGLDFKQGLRALEHDYPRWHTWVGVAGLLYASRIRTSPPRVVRDTTVEGLRAKVQTAERKYQR